MSKKKRRLSRTSLKQVKRKAVKLFVCVGLISTLAIVGYGAWTARHILEPISSHASTEKSIASKFSEQVKFYTLTLDEDEFVQSASFTIIDTHEQSLKTIRLPQETIVRLPYGMDEFKLASLYKVTPLENTINKNNLIIQTLVEYFGLPVERLYIIKNTENGTSFNEWLTHPVTLFKLTFDQKWAKHHVITNETPLSLIELARIIHKVPNEFNTTIDIKQYGIGIESKNKDGTTILNTDRNKLDEYIKKSFQNIELIHEKLNIKIENSTEITGLGSKFSRIVTNMGGIVIDVGNSIEKTDTTIIYIKEEHLKETTTFHEISKILQSYEVKVDNEMSSGADISVRLGQSYALLIHGKTEPKRIN